jgi:hypothetical protein
MIIMEGKEKKKMLCVPKTQTRTWFSTIASTSETCSSAPSPWTRGMFLLTSTISRLAARAALSVYLPEELRQIADLDSFK